MNIIPAYERGFRIVQVIVQMILNGWSKLLFAGCCWLLLFTHYFLWKIVIFTCSAHARAVASSQSSPLRNTFFSSLNLFEHRSRHLRQGGVVGTGRAWSCWRPKPPPICKLSAKQKSRDVSLHVWTGHSLKKNNTSVLNRNYRKPQRTFFTWSPPKPN